VPIRFNVRKTVGNPVKMDHLKRGHSRRGVGRKEVRVGPNRDKKRIRGRNKVSVERDLRRRRDSRRSSKTKSYTSKTKY
jgi:hypothetical protein